MSLIHSEDSPLSSDGKMDISDTTSLDSGGVSLNDNTERMEKENLRISLIAKNTANYNNHQSLVGEENTNTTNSSALEMYNDNEVMNNKTTTNLDNRILKPLQNLTIESPPEDPQTQQQQQQRRSNISRTLADNHPLMLSPTGSDSDSEYDNQLHNHHNHQYVKPVDMENSIDDEKINENQKNYPDVVPTRERLHIQIPQPIEQGEQHEVSILNSKNINCDRKTISELTKNNKQQLIGHSLKPSALKSANFRASSPDLLSSGSEINVSQYQATVDTNYQTVALMPKKDINDGAQNKHLKNAKKAEDISSLDSISNHSFDGDEEHNLASLSPSSSLIDGLDDDDDNDDDDDDDDCEGPELLPDDDYVDDEQQFYHTAGHITPTPGRSLNSPCRDSADNQQLPQYSAAEERRDSRNWQKITLPDGRTRDIDMRVIEPYKRVLSHGGYLKAGGHNAIVIFCACHLPDRSRTDYSYVMDNLFLYVVKTLEQLVTDDYVLIYLHGGSSRRNMPPFPWLKKCYQLLDRRLRKSLKNMYLVHPTFWIKSIIWMTRPFVSTKFWRKLVYVKSLDELSQYVTALEKAAIPEKVKQYDSKKH
ncbi:protein PFC0760c isoform X1 [Lucilia sericata]|nr:protein PFC0760c isoform X1 [Lucilia sericata]